MKHIPVILPTDEDRANFKKRCRQLLKPLEDEFGIEFKFGPITHDMSNRGKMKCYFTQMKRKPVTAKFLNRNGYDHERLRAAAVFEEGKEYTIVGGSLYSSSSCFQFEGIAGSYNTVMFDTPWEEAQHLMNHNY